MKLLKVSISTQLLGQFLRLPEDADLALVHLDHYERKVDLVYCVREQDEPVQNCNTTSRKPLDPENDDKDMRS